uniref:Proline-rich protein PRCC n=1 Tax=Loa loa TaxID=7209 RepID=A0A1I7VDC9_LOALO
MLSLVDYAGSDDEDIDELPDGDRIYAEVVSNPVKRLIPPNRGERTIDGFQRQEDDAVVEECDGITNAEGSSILTNLPPSIPLANKRVQQEEELDDLVKRKDWELKLARKAKRKRKRHCTHVTNSSSKNHHSSKDLADNRSDGKKMVVIQAFSGLKGLVADGNQGESDKQLGHSMVASASASLLTVLPEPKNATGISKNSNLFMCNSTHSTENVEMPKVLTAREISMETKFAGEKYDASDEDDSTDFFGLKAIDDPPMVSDIISVSDASRDIKLEQIELTDDVKVENNISAFVSHPEVTAVCCDTSASTTLSGAIDDSQALCMIYSRDVAHLGGSVSNAAEAVENMVDVSVDKVLGPNVRATLLKNLHNKSLAEATLSHLANVPKSKETVSMVARRKHQITYLASVAVAREEQLAEQWSVNRHNKRTSARKYGF